jgi:hypothetical protein
VPISQGNDKRVASIQLQVVLEQPAPSVERPWRLPIVPK